MPTQRRIQQRTSAAAGVATILQTAKPTKVYEEEYKRYVKWILENGYNADSEGRYLTRDNINSYYQLHVATTRVGNRGTLTRIGNALQWFCNNRYCIRSLLSWLSLCSFASLYG